MKVSNQKNSLHRPQSPTLSDGSNPKRLHLGSDDLDPDEKFEKIRRIDSPTETSPRLGMQFSPQIGGLSLSGKGSPKDNPAKRSVSPKALYPPSIQKFLNGKSTLTIEEAIDKLKTPSNKTHKGQLEKMKMLGAFQKQEVASNVAFRKAYSNSPASVSPARSTSPVGSPMVISPRHEGHFQESENIVMTFEAEGDSPMTGSGLMGGAMGKMNFPKQNVDNWLSNMGVQANNGMFQQDNHQQGLFNNNGRSQQNNIQMNQGNFGNNSMQGGQRAPFNQFQQNNNNNNQSKPYNSTQLTPQALAFLNSQTQEQGGYRDHRDRGGYEDDEPRERTNSFLRLPRDLANPPESNYRSLADTQLNAIQSIMRATRAISPTEPNRGVMQQFQKRNSNPESMMMNNGPMQMQQPLFENRPSAFNQNMLQDFNTGFNGGMQQQYGQYNNNMHHQQGQGMFSMQNQQMHMNDPYSNQNNMMKREYAPQQQQQQQHTAYGGYGQVGNMGMQGHESKQGMGAYNDQMVWNMQNQIGGDPEGFLFEKNETEDFDLNIIPSDLNFMPNRQGMEELADPNDNNLIVPDPTGMDPFYNSAHGMFRFNS